MAVQGGTLGGTGTVAGDLTNAAVVAPGVGLGVLTVTGNYTQTAAGTLAIETGGPGAGQTDRLAVGGAVTLDGALTVGSVNGYFAAVGDTLTVLDPTDPATIGGTFAGLDEGDTLDSDGPTTFAVSYAGGSGNDVTLTAINRAPTLDTIPDPSPTLEDPGPNTINLTGISSGNVEPQTLTVTAVSDNPGLVPDPVVDYTSPNTAGSLTYTPTVFKNGTAHITVTVTDSGGTATAASTRSAARSRSSSSS